MLPTRRIQKNYEIFFSLLKFVLENNEQPKYKDLDLVETFSRLLKEIKEELEDFFGEPVNKEHEIDFKVLVSPFLKEGFEDIDKKIQKIGPSPLKGESE